MKHTDIIMINMSGYAEWQRGVSNRNYHVLRELASNPAVGRILAVDYPPLTLKRAIRNSKENILKNIEGGEVIRRSLTDKLTKLSDKLYVYSNSEFFLRPEKTVAAIKHAAIDSQIGDYILWSFFPMIMPYLREAGQVLTVFDAVDNWAEHSSYTHFKKRLLDSYDYIRQNADVIFTVSDELQALFDNQSNVYWIPNGVDLKHYQEKPRILNRDIADIPHPIIGYIGVVEKRVDVELISFLAEKNPTKSFVVVGPVWESEDIRKLKERPNIYILGYKSYDEAPTYIQQFDVALIPHRETSFITSTNPMKLYEYLACGKPVVATRNSGAEQFSKNVYIADDYQDFNRKIFAALEADSEEKQAERIDAVKEYSWNAIVKQMLHVISKKLEG